MKYITKCFKRSDSDVSGEIVCITMKRVCGFAASPYTRYALLRHITVLRTYMRPIVTDRVAWSVGLSVGLSH